MLTNVISHSIVGHYGALNVISWKYTFKRLNEDYEIANKKKQALDNLYESGKISQATRDSFTGDINAAIGEIEKQRKELAEKMQGKTQELESQLKTLEMLLANYEIQHVVGEIDEDSYTREINLLSNTLQTTRNELDVIKQATNQLFPVEPAIQAPAAPEPVAPTVEAVAEAAPVEAVPLEVPVEATPVETTIIETAPVDAAPVETAPIETPVAEAAPTTVPFEAPVEAPVEQATEAPVETAPIIESAPAVEAPAPEQTTPLIETPIETTPIETPVSEAPTTEAAVEPAPAPVVEAVVEEAAPIIEAPVIETVPEAAPIIEAPKEVTPIIEEAPIIAVEVPTETIATTEPAVEETHEEQVVEAPLQAFEVTEPTTVETTLEKVLEEPAIEPVSLVEEAHIPAHPLEAPQQAHSELTAEADSDQTHQAEESEENTTE